MEFNNGYEWHYVTDPDAYLRERDMYEMRDCSASGGRLFVDPEFSQQRDAMADVRCFMAYQFPYQNAGSPEYQADFFCDTLGKLRPNEIIMLDTDRGWFPGSPHGPGDVNYTDLATEQILAHCRGDQDATRRRKVLLLND